MKKLSMITALFLIAGTTVATASHEEKTVRREKFEKNKDAQAIEAKKNKYRNFGAVQTAPSSKVPAQTIAKITREVTKK